MMGSPSIGSLSARKGSMSSLFVKKRHPGARSGPHDLIKLAYSVVSHSPQPSCVINLFCAQVEDETKLDPNAFRQVTAFKTREVAGAAQSSHGKKSQVEARV